jgi:protein gp37
MNPDWARAIRDRCRESGTPFFFKQLSRKKPIPIDLMVREFPRVRL